MRQVGTTSNTEGQVATQKEICEKSTQTLLGLLGHIPTAQDHREACDHAEALVRLLLVASAMGGAILGMEFLSDRPTDFTVH